jgi:cell division protein FtsL
MSVPARRVDVPAPRPRPSTPERPATPARTTAARPQTISPPKKRRRARRGLHPRFVVFASVLVVALVVGVVALNALFAQTAFAVHAVQGQVADLAHRNDELSDQAAQLSSPSRIAEWASRYQMVAPGTVVILHVPRLTRSRTGSA